LICTDTFGLALRFRYHIGLVAAPPLEATSTTRLPSRRYSRGLTRGSPDLRPVVVSSATGAPCRNVPPSLPPVFLYRKVWARDIHLMMVVVRGEFRPLGAGLGDPDDVGPEDSDTGSLLTRVG
jgi:hypothetical protein